MKGQKHANRFVVLQAETVAAFRGGGMIERSLGESFQDIASNIYLAVDAKQVERQIDKQIYTHTYSMCVCVCVCIIYIHIHSFIYVVVQTLCHVPLFATPWATVAHPASLSMAFTRQEYWNRLPFPSPGDLPDPGIEPAPLALPGKFFDSANSALTTELLRKPPICQQVNKNYKCNIKCQNTIHLSPKLSQIIMVNSSPEYVFM